MPTIMKRRNPLAKESVDIQSRAMKRLKAMEEAGDIMNRTPAEIKQSNSIDDVFDMEAPIPDIQEQDPGVVNRLIDMVFNANGRD